MPTETILITAPTLHPQAQALLKDYRLIFTGDKLSEAELVDLCVQQQPVAILARYGHFGERVLGASPKLKVVSRHGVGMDSIDQTAAARLGIPVEGAFGSNSQAVAELAIGMMFGLARKLTWLDARMRQHHWDKDGYRGMELSGKTLGIVGCGSVGRRVAKIALAFGMKVVVSDPYLDSTALPEGATPATLASILPACDVLTFHCPLNDETRGMLGAVGLALMKPSAIVINTARAGILDEAAMLANLADGRLALGLDCFVEEPLGAHSPWLTSDRTILTPHIGGTTDEGLKGMGVGAARNILKHLQPEGAPPLG
jgi:D-3-phosphoglycerate dehydrogenase